MGGGYDTTVNNSGFMRTNLTDEHCRRPCRPRQHRCTRGGPGPRPAALETAQPAAHPASRSSMGMNASIHATCHGRVDHSSRWWPWRSTCGFVDTAGWGCAAGSSGLVWLTPAWKAPPSWHKCTLSMPGSSRRRTCTRSSASAQAHGARRGDRWRSSARGWMICRRITAELHFGRLRGCSNKARPVRIRRGPP